MLIHSTLLVKPFDPINQSDAVTVTPLGSHPPHLFGGGYSLILGYLFWDLRKNHVSGGTLLCWGDLSALRNVSGANITVSIFLIFNLANVKRLFLN